MGPGQVSGEFRTSSTPNEKQVQSVYVVALNLPATSLNVFLTCLEPLQLEADVVQCGGVAGHDALNLLRRRADEVFFDVLLRARPR